MSGVLHPVGPEPARTYWLRRTLVIAVLLALLGGLVVTLTQLGTAATQAAVPPPATGTGLASSPNPSGSLSAAAPASAGPFPSRTAKASPSADPGSAKPSSTSTKTPGCDPAKLRPTLRGDRSLATGHANTFVLSLINGSGSPCTVRVDRDHFELKIYSGTDRIWTTKDCSTAVRTISAELGAEQAVEWRLRWDGRRSRGNCKDRSESTRPGVYWATAQLAGAKPVQLRMILH